MRLEGTALEPLIRQLYDELTTRGLLLRPPCHIGDEWFVPVGIPAIFVPFFLVHDRLRALERTMMLEVEGGTKEWFMKLIRHEAAHAYSYAYQLPRKKKWQQTFGRTSREETPDFYHPRPFSRSYVVHLDDWYAQSHPDEDFAETFAVWLTPGLDWRTRYAGWKALQKLEYVDELMRSLVGNPPRHLPDYRVADYDCLNQKLKTYYARKRKLYEDTYPDFYDADLRQLFAATAGPGRITASCLSPAPPPAAFEFGLPVDEREEIPGQQTPRPADRSLRSARSQCPERRSAAGFSGHLFHHHAGHELSFHRQVQAHQMT